MERSNLLGALSAVIFYLSAILVFISRLAGKPDLGKWMGLLEFLLVVPMVWLLFKAPGEGRPALYYVQIAAVLLWLLVELLLDYILKLDFRQVRWMVITYVMIFFAAAGGLLGLASKAGRGWSLASIILFFIMAVLTFVQRWLTGY